MSAMYRLLTAILLAGAVGGVAVFARHLGRVPEPVAVRLAAPPPGHLTAPGVVHAPLLVTARPAATFGSAASALRPVRQALPAEPLTLPAAKPLTVQRATTPHRQPARPNAKPATKTTTTTTPVAAPAATPPEEPVRVLAAVPLTPATTTVSTPSTSTSSAAAKPRNGKGHAYGHLKQAKAGKSPDDPAAQQQPPASIPATPEPPAPAVTPAAIVELTPADPRSVDSADADEVVHGHGWGRGNKGHRG